MKKLIMIILMIIVFMLPVFSLEVPSETDTRIMQQINQEHSNTRKFTSDEIARQRNEFFKQFDDRATYYETTYQDMLTKTTWKLSLLWAGITFFFVSFNNIVRNNLEKRRFKKLKESLKSEIMGEMKLQDLSQTQQEVKKDIFTTKKGYDVETDELFKTQVTTPNKDIPKKRGRPRKSFIDKIKDRSEQKRLKKLEKERERLKELFPEMYKDIKKSQDTEPGIVYSNTFEVDY